MPDSNEILVQSALVVGILAGALYVLNNRLLAYYRTRPLLKFRRQILQVVVVLTVILLAIILIPFSDEDLRGHLLGLFGLVISATIALSSTTLVGNMMAGIMLKTIDSCKPGDYITVGEHFGRISEMDLLHTEIQTEQRDLTTLPNLYLVANPVRVMHSSGTVLSVDLSLGYDVPRQTIERLLIEAATAAGLESPYVQIRELGDHSISYSVSGLLKEVNHMLAKRRELRAQTIDALHSAGIEIVSPTFMNTRAYSTEKSFISKVKKGVVESEPETSPDALVFDKAEKAESVSKLREKLEQQEERLNKFEEVIASANKEETKQAAIRERDSVQHLIERLKKLIETKEEHISEQ